MKIEITRKFQRQLDSCTDQSVRKKVAGIIENIVITESLSGISSLKKLKGYENCYRIRIGNYRLGLILRDNFIIFAAFDHRSDIYKYFP